MAQAKKRKTKTTQKNTKQAKQDPIYKKVWFWVVVGIVAFVMIGTAMNRKPKDDKDAAKDGGNSQPVAQGGMTSDGATNYCQDAGLLNKYISKDVDIISILNLNERVDKFGGWYDSDGNEIWYVRWNGKNDKTKELVTFDCWVSGKDDSSIKLHYLEIGGVPVLDIRSMNIFDRDKNKIYAE